MKQLPKKRKQSERTKKPSNYDVTVGIDPILYCLFVGKNNFNASKQYDNDCQYKWEVAKRYKQNKEWMDNCRNMPTMKT